MFEQELSEDTAQYYRLYIRFKGRRYASYHVRNENWLHVYWNYQLISGRCGCFSARGQGIIDEDGLELFEWLRNARNIDRLKKGLRHVNEVDKSALSILKKLFTGKRISAQTENLWLQFQEDWDQFTHARGFEKLELIARAGRDIGVIHIPALNPISGRSKLSGMAEDYQNWRLADPAGWAYLLNLDANTIEVFESKSRHSFKDEPTVQNVSATHAEDSPSYYCKIQLSELQAMWRKDWIRKHEVHVKALNQLWQERGKPTQETTNKAKLSFQDLYDISFNNRPPNGPKRRYPRRDVRQDIHPWTHVKNKAPKNVRRSRNKSNGHN